MNETKDKSVWVGYGNKWGWKADAAVSHMYDSSSAATTNSQMAKPYKAPINPSFHASEFRKLVKDLILNIVIY